MQVEIRPLIESDAQTSVHWRNNPAIWAQTESAPDRTITVEDEVAWVTRVMADEASRRFAIIADDTYVGNIYLTDIANGHAEYHIFIGDQRYWGKGIAKAASLKLIAFASGKLSLDQIHLKVRNTNESAVHLYEKLGFVASGEDGDFVLMTLQLG